MCVLTKRARLTSLSGLWTLKGWGTECHVRTRGKRGNSRLGKPRIITPQACFVRDSSRLASLTRVLQTHHSMIHLNSNCTSNWVPTTVQQHYWLLFGLPRHILHPNEGASESKMTTKRTFKVFRAVYFTRIWLSFLPYSLLRSPQEVQSGWEQVQHCYLV
jgi:hypothetical protein